MATLTTKRYDSLSKPLGDIETVGELERHLGRKPSNDEYREFIYPKIVRSYQENKAVGMPQSRNIAELQDAYYYPDLIKKAIAESGDSIEEGDQRFALRWRKYR